FLWASVAWLTPALMTPDLCVAACAYVATAILMRIHRGLGTWPGYFLLGAVLGLGFLAKAFMFLVGWAFLACALFAAQSVSRALLPTEASAAIFLLIAAPQILALSHVKGRWTFSDSGRLNYAWFVDRIPAMYWEGGPPPAGTPLHPPRQLVDHPRVFEFVSP